MNTRTVQAVEHFLNALKRKDLSDVPLAHDVVFEAPLSPGKLHGIDSIKEFLDGVFPIVKDIRIKQFIAEGEHVCALWELETSTPPAVIPVCEYFRVAGGLIKEIRPYYDPRPITNPAAG